MAAPDPSETSADLFLIDGNSLAYRAFFALPESIATSDGRPTNAIFGFASMMVKVLTEHRPAAVIVAWDAGLSGRKEISADYKAQRTSKPDLLREQWPQLAPLSEAFGFTNVSVPGYEADDVIATLTRRARERGTEVMVVTGDRDAFQLVDEGVRVMANSRGVTDTKIYDRAAVVERWGVEPEAVPDLIGLKGDTSDNIPGVPGIGEKTAAQLLGEYGTVEGVLENIDNVSGKKRKENLTDHAEDARMSRDLAKLVFDVEVEVDLDAVMASGPDLSRLRDFAAEFEMRQVIQRLEDDLGEAVPDRQVDERLEIDPEEGGPSDLAGGEVAIGYLGGRWGGYDGARLMMSEQPDPLALAEALGDRPILAHDAKELGGGGPGGLVASARGDLDLSFDTVLAAYLIDPARRTYVLAELAADEGVSVKREDEKADDGQLSLDGEEAGPSPAEHARLSWELAQRQRPKLKRLGLTELLADVEMPLVEVLAAMEREGLRLDPERIEAISTDLAGQADQLQTEIWELAGHEFTIGSPQQLAEVLFEELGLSRKRRGKTGFST
ncbi:MAG: DNA polymerase, partial [Solirubrobacterales bacterium]